jgi:pimeloyl-ACP methyl ester carboxylesterase
VDAARARHHLGRLAWVRGDGASAVNGCHEALAGQLQAGDRLGLVETLETLGGLLIDEGRAERGLPLLAAAATARDGLDFPLRPMEADLWFAQVTDLAAAGHTVITFDNRGCGRSEAPPAPYSVTGMAADTAALIEHLGLGPCDVIGYSLGGYIAQELAVARADLVRRLVLLAGAGPAPAYAVARARAAVDLARALDPLPPSFDVADLLLSLHPMAQLQNERLADAL